MRESKSDLWADFGKPGHRIAISTNGFVKANGEAVMGRGCAKQATQLFEGVAKRFGAYLRKNGNIPGYLLLNDLGSGAPAGDRLMILPVKHNWWEAAELGLITKSRDFLCGEAVHNPDWIFHVPRLGCGNGRLDWSRMVRPLMEILPDNVVVHS